MKKLLFLIIMLFTSSFVFAEGSCKVVEGTGTEIGDEIACESEHFYVMSNDGNKVKMMAKYNLYVGDDVNKTYHDFNSETELYDYISSFPLDSYQVSADKFLYNYGYDDNQAKYYTIIGDAISSSHVLQDKKALGFVGEYKNNTHFPFYGVIDRYLFSNLYFEESFYRLGVEDNGLDFQNDDTFYYQYKYDKELSFDKFREINDEIEPRFFYWVNNDLSVEERYQLYKDSLIVKNSLEDYKKELNNIGVESVDVKMPSMEDINDLLKEINGSNLDMDSYVEGILNGTYGSLNLNTGYIISHIDNLKNYVSEKYNWIYGTTYYTETVFSDRYSFGFFLISTRGDLCLSQFCGANSFIGGLRPVVTVNVLEIAGGIEENEQPKEQPKQTEEKVNPKTVDIISIVGVLFLLSLSSIFVLSKKKVLNK